VNELHVGIGFSTQLQKTTSDDLASAIRQVTTDPSYAMHAKQVGMQLRSHDEDGTQRMVEEVESFWNERVATGLFCQDLDDVRNRVVEWHKEQQRQKAQRSRNWIMAVSGGAVLAGMAAAAASSSFKSSHRVKVS
jgi:hypothetical protein